MEKENKAQLVLDNHDKTRKHMKEELSSLDIKIIVSEMQSLGLIGARMEKFYQKEREIHILLHIPQQGTHTLVLGSGKIFLTKKRFEYGQVPPTFAMTLRKYLGGKKIAAISQHEFDRVIVIETDAHKIIAELFRNGNIVLTDPEYKIWSMLERQEWKDRAIKMRETYKFPARGNTHGICGFQAFRDPEPQNDEIFSKLKESDRQVVVFLASVMSFGGEYAEEILFRANIDKTKSCKTLSEKEISAISREIKKILEEKPAPYVVLDAEKAEDFAPFEMARHKGKARKETSTFNEAVADYFSCDDARNAPKIAAAVAADKGTAAKFNIRLQQQMSAIARIESESKHAKKTGDLIYANFELFQQAVAEKERHKINRKEKTITIAIEGEKVVVFYEQPLSKSAEKYYGRAKKLKEKVARLKLEIERTKKEMSLHKKDTVQKKSAPEPKKIEWYHKYRWFFTSGGFLCVSGKDADTNEELIKKRVEKTDIVIHADITGSPFGLLKTRGKPADEKSIKEALEFVASYSRAWQAGVGIVDAYWVLPEQVTKKTPAGEYIGKGSFMVYGKKNSFKTELRLAIGVKNGEAVAGAISSVPEPFAVIKPGRSEAKKLAEEVKAYLITHSTKELKSRAEKISLDEIARHIPFGKGELAI
ncbi:NFACT family protein [archaeon]|nr:NFACT family protein [Nanoarchaeota archaeon]MBU4451586.1 NFACT family protein [Nanoarchaeota archaeon]MCG2724336.1 NFACT family protein [archaeon]